MIEIVAEGLLGGKEVRRRGTIEAVYTRNIVCLRASDGVKPVLFFVKDSVDWDSALQQLAKLWRSGQKVPPPFTPKKRLPPAWVDSFEALDTAGRLAMLDKLREGGFLPKIKALQPGTQPPWLDWTEVSPLCILPADSKVKTQVKTQAKI